MLVDSTFQDLRVFLGSAISSPARTTQTVGNRLIGMRRLVGQFGSTFANFLRPEMASVNVTTACPDDL